MQSEEIEWCISEKLSHQPMSVILKTFANFDDASDIQLINVYVLPNIRVTSWKFVFQIAIRSSYCLNIALWHCTIFSREKTTTTFFNAGSNKTNKSPLF